MFSFILELLDYDIEIQKKIVYWGIKVTSFKLRSRKRFNSFFKNQNWGHCCLRVTLVKPRSNNINSNNTFIRSALKGL